MYLKQNNPFYHDVRNNIDHISDELLDLTEEILICAGSNEEDENPLDSYQLNSEETMLSISEANIRGNQHCFR